MAASRSERPKRPERPSRRSQGAPVPEDGLALVGDPLRPWRVPPDLTPAALTRGWYLAHPGRQEIRSNLERLYRQR